QRFLFKCVQEPVSGRRKTDKDRRSLAPVPIVRMWVKECYQDVMGGWSESDLDLSDIDPSCLICEAEISPPVDLPAGVLPQSLKTQGPSNHRSSWISDQHWDTRSVAGPSGTMQGYPEQVQHLIADAPGDTGRTRKLPHAQPDEELEGSGRSGKKARLEVGRNLFGALHVSGVKVVAPSGELGLWFLFTDLCVGTEGNYRLRFRVFDLSVIKPQMPPVPHFANCESEIFKVWAPKAFPGIPKPTELTEHFIKQGFKLNARKNERTARTPPPE
ncbi:velvet factor, partial [Dioszegia hungarica]